MSINDKPIGFFDSGVGGISVLKEAFKLLPNENFLYYGDSKNAPYGTKKVEEVKELTFNAIDFLMNKGIKALVIACNTATSVTISDLRKTYDMPIIGIEPALKPAVELKKNGKIIIMATPMTLAEKKFENLMNLYRETEDIEPLPCPGLVEFIESGKVSGEEVYNYLKDKFKKYNNENISAIVLGCTHYPFIKETLRKVIDNKVIIIDGSVGTSKELKRQLKDRNILREEDRVGKVTIFNSREDEEIINLSYNLLNMK
ncbi:glutamate racemase [Clostridium tepidum]|uniref:Glutamate racemase n=1 Tax=Clostridium tepidum TaxID=1962263 RepID=A0A1S9IGW1_9CLOT|nr:glutamate racemase [Clostridium tepidum]MCR1934885.1 glutamate racemase [Clostridium tepidum]MDU6878760.1 glutamate racemase [Clostridium botulinum]OOO61863.1 glutamate racemase [Clostridium tepidum]OOO69483.1 glutamate racemase [Clostridium tepidum]